jgi:nitrous oxidase accessory protein
MTLRARRGVLMAAAVLTLASSALPLWGFRMSAPQYPGESLHLRVTTSGIQGDVQEVQTLQKYIGVRFPRDLPELRWLVPALAGLSTILVLAAASGQTRWGRVMCGGASVAILSFVAGSAALLQVRLYDVGHQRDPRAPIRAVHDFTPLLVGPKKVGNFTVWSYPHFGAWCLALAVLLTVVAARQALASAHWPRGLSVRVAAVAILIIFARSTPAATRTWTVGGPGADFPLIAPAIASAREGDEIVVRAGVYREDLVINQRLRLRGERWPVLIGTGLGTVIEVHASDCEISGLAIEGSGTGLSQRMDAGIALLSDHNRVLDNRLQRVFYGIVMAGAAHNEIRGNEITGFLDLPYSRRGDGIYAYRAPDNRVIENRVTGERDGIYFQYAPRSQAADNVVQACRYALHDMFSDDATIERNVFRSSSAGANVMNSRHVSIRDNQFDENRGVSAVGLSLKECDDSTIEENGMRDNASGIKVEGSSGNRFVSNEVVGNDHGISLFASAEGNTFTRNQFIGNGSDVVLRGSGSRTRWSEAGIGNFWDSYRGFDFQGDGRGSSPHPILGPFERLEGNNSATRLFLRSPTATALALAARFAPDLRDETSDAAPLVRRSRPDRPRPHAGPLVAGVVATGLVIGLLKLDVRLCSK